VSKKTSATYQWVEAHRSAHEGYPGFSRALQDEGAHGGDQGYLVSHNVVRHKRAVPGGIDKYVSEMSSNSVHRWELLDCALRGHVLVGRDAATVTPADDLIVRDHDGIRWLRCLRCDGWFPYPIPETPSQATVRPRHEIALPLRGALLRDRYVLRLIAIDRAIHVLLLVGVAVVLFVFVSHRNGLQGDYNSIMNSLLGSSGGPGALRGFLGRFHKFFLYNPKHLDELAVVALGYAALEATEMVGLWFAKRWAEYLTFLATAILLPLEVYELTTKLSIFKIVIFLINLAIVVYLVFAKRLFGVRGGGRAERARRLEENSWAALERALPTPAPTVQGRS
jgi:hypothetical protein